MKSKKDYIKKLRDWLADADFPVDDLTDDQVWLIHEPNESPENFHHDGELTFKEAATFWIERMKEANIPIPVINQTIRYNFALDE